jgi:hypothetical protein
LGQGHSLRTPARITFAAVIELLKRSIFYSFPDHCQCGKQEALHLKLSRGLRACPLRYVSCDASPLLLLCAKHLFRCGHADASGPGDAEKLSVVDVASAKLARISLPTFVSYA